MLNASVRDNILFGSEMDEQKYYKVIQVCQLKSDFEMMSNGDKTMVGEQGGKYFIHSL